MLNSNKVIFCTIITPFLRREFDDTIDALQGDIEALEGEKAELKEKIKLFSKKTLLDGLGRSGSSQSGKYAPGAPVLVDFNLYIPTRHYFLLDVAQIFFHNLLSPLGEICQPILYYVRIYLKK